MWDPKSPWADRRVRLAANHAIDRKAISEAETLGASPPTGNIVPKGFEFALPHRAVSVRSRARPSSSWPRPAIPTGSTRAIYPWPPYFSAGEAIVGYLAAVGIKTRMRTMERAAFYAALATKKLRASACASMPSTAMPPRACRRPCPSDGAFAYGGWPDVDALYKQQARETDKKKREAMLRQIQQILHERVRFAPMFDYIWPSGVGPRVEDPALMLINPYPWSAPYEEVKLKKK